MSILVFTPWVPSRRRPRARRLIEILAQHTEVHCLAVAWSREEETEDFPEGISSSHLVRASRIRALTRVARTLLFSTRSLQQAYLDDPGIRRSLTRLHEKLAPELTLFNVIRSAALVEALPANAVASIDLDEIRSDYYRQLGQRSRSLLHRLIGRIESPRMAGAEKAALGRYTRTLVSSPVDLDAHERTRLVRTPVDFPGSATRNLTTKRVVIVGRMSYRANQEAVLWFIANVWPTVVSEHPDAVFEIVGEAPPRQIRRLAGVNVRVVGRVQRIEDWVEGATVSIVPVFLATGVQLKLLESFAARTPVVTTPLVATLAGVTDEHCTIAANTQEWIEKISALLAGESDTTQVERAAGWLLDHHSTAAVEQALLSALGIPVSDVTAPGS